VADAASALTSAGAVVGTPAYMAPEQHLGETVGPAADQFAFAATLYEGLFGVRPFPGTTLAALISEVLSGKVRPVPETSEVPRAVRDVVLRGLAREAGERWPSVQAMLEALAEPASQRASRRSISAPVAGAAIVAGVTVAALVTWKVTREEPGPGPRASTPTPTPGTSTPTSTTEDHGAAGPRKEPFSREQLLEWDTLARLPEMERLAKEWQGDARLFEIGGGKFGADGIVDVANRNPGTPNQVSYHFVSKTAGEDCWLELMVRDGRYHDIVLTPRPGQCDEYVPVGAPKCTLEQMWKKLEAEGAKPEKGFAITYDAKGWNVRQYGLRRDFVDGECETTASAIGGLDAWDVSGGRAPIDERAKAWAGDAELQAILTYGVGADGIADTTRGDRVEYLYRSATIAAGDDLVQRNRCMQLFTLQSGAMSQADSESSNCPELRAPGPPRCTFVQIWKRAQADGIDPAVAASIQYLYLSMTAKAPVWLVQNAKVSKQYPDDC
jgi:hypothetical protein